MTVNSFMPHLRRFAALRVSFFVFADAADVIVCAVAVVVIAVQWVGRFIGLTLSRCLFGRARERVSGLKPTKLQE